MDGCSSRRLWLGLLVVIAAWLQAGAASASSSFPGVVESRWSLPRVPDCTLCHSSSNGGKGTVTTYFGLTMQEFGAVQLNNGSLVQALDRDQAADYDSDGDGVSDMEELVHGTDPNDGPGPKVVRFPSPQHGCSVSRARTRGSGLRDLGYGAPALLWLLWVRRKKRSPTA